MSKYYLTTSIAYSNGRPHLGHALEAIQADVLARYHRSAGAEVFLLTGMDEHGQKIKEAAEAASKTAQEQVDEVSQYFIDLYKTLGISNDGFVRTTAASHKAASQKLWKACEKDIYKAKYSGLYCVGCERFYTDKELVDGKCPQHMVVLQELALESYFFKLSAYTAKLKKLILSGNIVIWPEARRNEILGLIEVGLEDISISRPVSQLEWGVPVPGDPQHVMYVWFDALANYISAIGYADDTEQFKTLWPADLHLIGKDILRFHAALWPAMLLSAGLEPPKAIAVHGFLTTNGQKMSKSLGNVIDPVEIIDIYGPDALRYFLMSQIPAGLDGDVSLERFAAVYNSDLANELGNLVQRVSSMFTRYFHGLIGPVPNHAHDRTAYETAMKDMRFDHAMHEVWVLVKGLNQYIDEEKPWVLAQTDTVQLQAVLAHAVADLVQISTLLLPFMPHTAGKIQQIFNGDHIDASVGILFPKVDTAAAEVDIEPIS